MLTKGDIEDVIFERLHPAAGGAAPSSPKKVTERGKRVFLSDYELRKLLVPGSKTIKVPANAIISPLSEDWLDYDGFTIVAS